MIRDALGALCVLLSPFAFLWLAYALGAPL
jgi:hypothetical protein